MHIVLWYWFLTLLKAIYSQKVAQNPPLTHDLFRLAEKSDLEFDEGQKDILDTITTFNIQAWYDDYKLEFHNKNSKHLTEMWIQWIEEVRKWIKNNHLDVLKAR